MTTWPNWVDLVVLIFVLRGCYVGFNSGIVSELLHGLGAVGVAAASIAYWPILARWLQPWMGSFNPIICNLVVFWLLFLVLIFAVRQLINVALSAVKWEKLHWLLQSVAVVLGGVRGLWWSGFMLLILTSSQVTYLQACVEDRSVLGPRVVELSHQYLELVSDRLPGSASRIEMPVPPMTHASDSRKSR